MKFTYDDLEKVSKWETLLHHFRDGKYVDELQVENEEIKPFIKKLRSYEHLRIDVLERGNYGSYYSVFVSSDYSKTGKVEGFQVNLSTLLPYAVLGRAHVTYSEKGSGYSLLDLHELISPNSLTCSITVAIKDSLLVTCYKLCESDDLDIKLPDDVRPMDYCVLKEPWDRIFHIAFQSTD